MSQPCENCKGIVAPWLRERRDGLHLCRICREQVQRYPEGYQRVKDRCLAERVRRIHPEERDSE